MNRKWSGTAVMATCMQRPSSFLRIRNNATVYVKSECQASQEPGAPNKHGYIFGMTYSCHPVILSWPVACCWIVIYRHCCWLMSGLSARRDIADDFWRHASAVILIFKAARYCTRGSYRQVETFYQQASASYAVLNVNIWGRTSYSEKRCTIFRLLHTKYYACLSVLMLPTCWFVLTGSFASCMYVGCTDSEQCAYVVANYVNFQRLHVCQLHS